MNREQTDTNLAVDILDWLHRAKIDPMQQFAGALEWSQEHPRKLSNKLLALGCPVEDVAKLETEMELIYEDRKHFPGAELAAVLRESATLLLEPIEPIDLNRDVTSSSHRFSSTIPELDRRTEGGLYGLTVVGGNAGVGKSMLAIGVAVEFALAGGKAVYFNAEMTSKQILQRVWNASCGRREQIVGAPLRLRHVTHTVTVESLIEQTISDLDAEDSRLLVVIDSINTVADMVTSQGQIEYFQALAQLIAWCATVRRRSEGSIMFLLVSELNAKGDVKGLKLEYVADLVLRITKGERSDCVVIECTKGREGGRGELGTHVVDWRAGRLRGPD
jgi:predicted ATP-dependent serine protease